jgi:hypothetical protein
MPRKMTQFRQERPQMNLVGDLLWCAANRGPIPAVRGTVTLELKPSGTLYRLATIAALAAAMALSACGRKGPLDPPPGGMVLEQRPGMTPVTRRGAEPPRPEYDEDGRPVAPEGPRRRSPLDWLID